jgi:mevalonate kinase
MNNNSKVYPSKIMLFGEYAVIAGGEGLAIPYHGFSAKWINETTTASAYKPHLISFLEWLQQNDFSKHLDLNRFDYDLHHGLDIISNVPIGYGVGSSGVVTAAVFDKYALTIPEDLSVLKALLASMENYFHATSSGLDPLVCYLNKSIHVQPSGIAIVDAQIDSENIKIELADCGTARSTQQLVAVFKEKMNEKSFKGVLEDYIYLSNTCIHAWLQKDEALLRSQLRLLSYLQLNYFQFALPEHMRERWKAGLESGNEIMKLCGAGGGGFLIAFQIKKSK